MSDERKEIDMTQLRLKLHFVGTLLLIASLLLAACGGGSASTDSAPAGDAAGETANSEAKVAGSGFVCPEANPRMEVTSEELNLFVWTEYFPEELIECFELVYGIRVNKDEYSSNEEMYAKLSAGGAVYDIAQPTDYMVQLMIRQGLIQKLDKDKLKILGNMNPTQLNKPFDPNNEYTIPFQSGTYGIVINTEKVKTLPTKWADLWNEEYAGRMVFLDDARATIGLTLITLGYDVNTKDEKQLEEAKAKLAKLVPGIKLFDSDSPKTSLIAGDTDLGMTWTGEAVLAKRENAKIDYIYPAEGTIEWMDNYVVVKDAPHLDAAYAWFNYTMQGDIFYLMLRDFPYSNPNKAALDYAKDHAADLYSQYMDSPTTNTPPEILAKAFYLADVGEAAPIYDRIWTEVKGQ